MMDLLIATAAAARKVHGQGQQPGQNDALLLGKIWLEIETMMQKEAKGFDDVVLTRAEEIAPFPSSASRPS